jgi:hypothetical protein
MVEELQTVDETERSLFAALRLEADETAIPKLQILVRALPIEAGLQSGVDDLGDVRMCSEEVGDLGGVIELRRIRRGSVSSPCSN